MWSAFAGAPTDRDSRGRYGETAFAWLACLAEAHASALARVSEGWLGGRDSNPDIRVQSAESYR